MGALNELPYRRVGAGDFWVEDNNSAYYNTYCNVAQVLRRHPARRRSQRVRAPDEPTQYSYAIVVNFNRPPDWQQPYRGAGIFVHVRTGATAGCIATSAANVVTMLRLLRSGDTITIVA